MPAEPERILVRGVNWLGDAVMTTPALLRLREARRDAHITLLTPEKLKGLWGGHPAIDEVVTFNERDGFWSVGRKLRGGRFDIGLALPNSPRSALELWLAGIPQRVGYKRPWRDWLLTQRIAPPPGMVPMRKRSVAEIKRLIAQGPPAAAVGAPALNGAAHHVHHYLHLVAALGAKAEPLPPRIVVPEEVTRQFLARVKLDASQIWFGLNAGAEYGPAKRWPEARFTEAAIRIQRSTRCRWLIFGLASESEPCLRIASNIYRATEDDFGRDEAARNPHVVNLAGGTNLRELCAALKLCRVLLTNDSGPMHLAAALGTPVVVPFGSTSPELTGPGLPGDALHCCLRAGAACSPCFLRVCPIDFRCMTGIGVESVVDAVLKAAGAECKRGEQRRTMAGKLDAIVLGLGGMGSAAACHLAARGFRVLGLEQFTSPHNLGSSHGETRVIRQAYFESPAYVPLLLRAYELWRELERATNRRLLNLCGGLMLGQPGSAVVEGSARSAVQHGLPHELLDANEIHRRFPAMLPPAGTVGLFEKNAGFVLPEAGVEAHLERARQLGALLQFEERVLGWEAAGDGVRVQTSRGEYEARRLVITAGPWAGEVLADLRLPLSVERAVLYWFEPEGGIEPFLPERFPVFIYEAEDGLMPYGIPAMNGPAGGVKISFYHAPNPEYCAPGTIRREVREEESTVMRERIAGLIPALGRGRLLKAATCMYTNTPDRDFVIDLHPAYRQICFSAGFSGHGYKFCSVAGEILADLAERGTPRSDISLFRLERINLRRIVDPGWS